MFWSKRCGEGFLMEASLKLRLEEEGLVGGVRGGLAHWGNTRVSVRLEDWV